MSVQSEIDRINGNVASTYSALSEMGATMPETQNSDNLPNTVRTVPTGGGSGSKTVQSDWNQTDETAADFIKNKPFGDSHTVILEEQELPYDSEQMMCFGVVSATPNPGEMLEVIYDGTAYITRGEIVGDGYFAFGNLSLAGAEIDSGEPFVGLFMDGIVAIISMDELNHTVKISIAQYTKLPIQYLPTLTGFYAVRGTDDKYVYTDAACSVKATAYDIQNAVRYGPIVVLTVIDSIVVYAYTVSSVVYMGSYFELQIYNVGILYTAEYTP